MRRAVRVKVRDAAMILLLFLLRLTLASDEKCRLPEEWKGIWFQSGISELIEIDDRSIQLKGTCYEQSNDKFLFVDAQNCYKCIIIQKRHPNVLQYKEGPYCEEKDSFENLCNKIGGDAQLYSLFRNGSSPIDCPFKGTSLTFTYAKGDKECSNPISHIEGCTENSKLLFRYQACPDVPKTESTSEILECVGEWADGSHRYLVGKIEHINSRGLVTNEETYRCFIYEEHTSSKLAYKVAMSGDATCSGLFSPIEGVRTFSLYKDERKRGRCHFPAWLHLPNHHHTIGHGKWGSLDGRVNVHLEHRNSTLVLSTPNHGGPPHHSPFQTDVGSDGNPLALAHGADKAKFLCLNKIHVNEGYARIYVKKTSGCTSSNLCLHVHSRSPEVFEIESEEVDEESQCLKDHPRDKSSFETFVKGSLKSSTGRSKCPNLGKYLTKSISFFGEQKVKDPCAIQSVSSNHLQDSFAFSFSSLVFGCDEGRRMDFYVNCSHRTTNPNNGIPYQSYSCHKSWDDVGQSFIIASPGDGKGKHHRLFCFTYTETGEGLRFLSRAGSCQRILEASSGHNNRLAVGGEEIWSFNLSTDGQCPEALTSSSRILSCILTCDSILLFALLHFSLSQFGNNQY